MFGNRRDYTPSPYDPHRLNNAGRQANQWYHPTPAPPRYNNPFRSRNPALSPMQPSYHHTPRSYPSHYAQPSRRLGAYGYGRMRNPESDYDRMTPTAQSAVRKVMDVFYKQFSDALLAMADSIEEREAFQRILDSEKGRAKIEAKARGVAVDKVIAKMLERGSAESEIFVDIPVESPQMQTPIMEQVIAESAAIPLPPETLRDLDELQTAVVQKLYDFLPVVVDEMVARGEI